MALTCRSTVFKFFQYCVHGAASSIDITTCVTHTAGEPNIKTEILSTSARMTGFGIDLGHIFYHYIKRLVGINIISSHKQLEAISDIILDYLNYILL